MPDLLKLIEDHIPSHKPRMGRGLYGVSIARRYSGLEDVIFSAAISSKCSHLS